MVRPASHYADYSTPEMRLRQLAGDALERFGLEWCARTTWQLPAHPCPWAALVELCLGPGGAARRDSPRLGPRIGQATDEDLDWMAARYRPTALLLQELEAVWAALRDRSPRWAWDTTPQESEQWGAVWTLESQVMKHGLYALLYPMNTLHCLAGFPEERDKMAALQEALGALVADEDIRTWRERRMDECWSKE